MSPVFWVPIGMIILIAVVGVLYAYRSGERPGHGPGGRPGETGER